MNITVSARKMHLTDSLKQYVEEKTSSALGVFSIDPITADVVLHVEKNRANPKDAVAEITVFTKKHVIRAEEAAEDMYAAVDLAADKVSRQLRKYKTKIVDRRKNGKAVKEARPLEVDLDLLEGYEEEEGIVRTKTIDPKPMSESEAMLQIDLLGHDFYVYKDDQTDLVNVIYRRNDGGYGILKPEV